MRTRFVIVAVAASFLLAACTASEVDPGADIALGGSVVRQQGSPVADSRVVLTREPDLAEILYTGSLAGLPCLTDKPPALCKKARIVETGSDGRFHFDIKGSDTQTLTGSASTMGLSTKLDRGEGQSEGPGVSYRLQVQTEQLDVPLRIWEPTVEASADPRRARVAWSEVPASILPADTDLGRITTSVRFDRGSELVWLFVKAASGLEFDSRLLEETRGTFGVFAELDDVDVDKTQGTKLDIVFRSARLPYRGPAGKPVSRGTSCFAYDGQGKPVAQSPCRLTDGAFEASFDPKTESCPQGQECAVVPHTSAYVDLGAAKNVTLVVVRGCDTKCTVEASMDANGWSVVGIGQGPEELGEAAQNFAVTPAGPIQARYIRITPENQEVDHLLELSVWDDSPPPPEATAPSGSLITPEDADEFADEAPGPSRLIWIAIAALAIAALAVGAYLLVRKKA